MAFWENVEKLRKEQNTTYRWIAQKMEISETTISSMRKSDTEPRATDAVKLAQALNTTVETLCSDFKDPYFNKYMILKEALRKILAEC